MYSALIHRKLQERKKKKEETPTQYLYEMLAIASQTEVDTAAIISYTINGLPGPNHLKAYMYKADNLKDFKKKLRAYEIQYAMTRNDQVRNEQANKRNKEKTCDEMRIVRCHSCGDPSHATDDCPSKDKGPKCFKCNNFGHMSMSCSAPASKIRINIISPRKNQVRKQMEINDRGVFALFDTGSNSTVIREDMIEKRKTHCMKELCEEEIKGVGKMTKFKGKFKAKIQIDGKIHEIYCGIMSKEDIDEEAIIGYDLIQHCKMELTPDKLSLKIINISGETEINAHS